MNNFKRLELAENINNNENKLIIKSIVYALTAKCNMNCRYCGAYHPQDETVLDLDKILYRFDQIASLERIKLSGGEVTLEFDKCIKVCKYCLDRNIVLQLNTNTTILTENMLYQLKDAGLKTIHISLNFSDAISYKDYYGHDYFDRLIKNIKLSNEIFEECIVESLLCSDTLDHIIGVADLLKSIGVSKHEIQYGVTNDEWSNHIDVKEIRNKIIELTEKTDNHYNIYFTCFDVVKGGAFWNLLNDSCNTKHFQFTTCIDGRYQIHMAPNGDFVICDLGFRYLIGNIMSVDLNDIVSNDELSYFYTHHNCGKRIKLE